MSVAAPFISAPLLVEPQWTDYNGHLNMAYYSVLFDKAGDHALEQVGLGPGYIKRSGQSYFTLEAHLTYIRELHAGDLVTVHTQILGVDAKRLHVVQQMFHNTEKYLAAVCETMVMHIDMAKKKSSPFPDEISDLLREVAQLHADLPVPAQVGHRISLPVK